MRVKEIETSYRTRDIYPRLLRYTLRYWPWMALALVCMAVYAGLDTALLYILKPLLDGSIVERDPFMIRWIPVILFGLFLIRGVVGFGSRYGLARVARHVIFDVRRDIFAQFLRLPVAYFQRTASGKLTAKLTYYTSQIEGAGIYALTIVVQDSLRLVGFIGLMFYLNWLLALLTLTAGPLIAWVVRGVTLRFRRYSGRIQTSMGDITQISEEMLTGHRVVKIFGGEDYERKRFAKVNEHNRRMSMRMAATQAASVPVIQVISAFAVAGVVWVAVHQATAGGMTAGGLAAFFGAMLALMGPIKRLTNVNAAIQKGLAAMGSIFELLDESGEDAGGDQTLERAAGSITIDKLWFRYPDTSRDVLRGIDLDVKAGETIALVGRSGSGKSTLLSLLPRFYDPSQGRIRLDGADLRAYRLADLRAQVSLVDQNVVLFNDTVARNIAYGSLVRHGRGEIMAAARRAYAAGFIEALQRGYDTLIGQNGIKLSGGPRQRLAI
ncbi:MAG: ATP-binding cassette domain-containing protein, partial [Salinisphaera sp.]|nr:ATP-binding cassette domain-containing protein [Salinisphaera sp.]